LHTECPVICPVTRQRNYTDVWPQEPVEIFQVGFYGEILIGTHCHSIKDRKAYKQFGLKSRKLVCGDLEISL